MHIISMADEDCGSIAPAARQFEIFLDYLVAKSIACTSFFMDERYLGMLQPEHAAETAETRLLHALRTFVEQVPFICVCVSVCMYTYTHIRTHTHTYTHMCVCARAHAAETAETVRLGKVSELRNFVAQVQGKYLIVCVRICVYYTYIVREMDIVQIPRSSLC